MTRTLLLLACMLPSVAFGGADADELVEAVRGVFDAGFAAGNQSVNRARPFLNRARNLSPSDPRVEYAWGLVLLSQFQRDAALEQFSLGVGTEEAVYTPALRARAWLRMTSGKQADALSHLVLLTAELLRRSDRGEPGEDEIAAAEWMGRFLAAADKTAATEAAQKEVLSFAQRVQTLLDGPLADALQSGQKAVDDQYAQLQAEVETRKADRAAVQRASEEKKATEIEGTLSEIEQEKRDAELFARDAKSWLDETARKLDRELGKLERDYQFLLSQDQSVQRSMLEVRREMTFREFRSGNPRTLDPVYDQLALRMRGYEEEHQALVLRSEQVLLQAQAVVTQKAAAIQKYEQATGQLVKKQAGLDKWSERLKKQKKDLTSPASPVAERTIAERKLKSFRTMLEVDVIVERDKLLADLKAR